MNKKDIYWTRWSAIGTIGAAIGASLTVAVATYQTLLARQASDDMFEQVKLEKQLDVCANLSDAGEVFMSNAQVITFVGEWLTIAPGKTNYGEKLISDFDQAFNQLSLTSSRAKWVLPRSMSPLVERLRESANTLQIAFMIEQLKGEQSFEQFLERKQSPLKDDMKNEQMNFENYQRALVSFQSACQAISTSADETLK